MEHVCVVCDVLYVWGVTCVVWCVMFCSVVLCCVLLSCCVPFRWFPPYVLSCVVLCGGEV